MKIAAVHLINLLEYAQIRGFANTDIGPFNTSSANQESAMIPEHDFYASLKLTHQELHDDLWGIKAGNYLTLKLLGLIYQISLRVTTLGEAFHYLQSYLETTLPLINATTRITPELVTITMHIATEESTLNRVILENVLTIVSREIKMMATQEVSFALTSPYWHTAYPKGWDYGPDYTLAFEPLLLKAAIKNRHDEKLEILVSEYIKLIENLKNAHNSFTNQVKATMLSMSDPHLPDMAAIADAFYLTPRSLQRRLERENSSFRMLQQDLKKQICSFLLQHQVYTVTSMAYILGYAEPAAFIHSFKKWFGETPEKMRKQRLDL